MIKYLFAFSLTFGLLFAENINTAQQEQDQELLEEIIEPKVDCLILEDENSIICKFETNRQVEDKQIVVEWIDPNNEISRSRELIIPSGHASIYDYRYMDGREPGNWVFKVIYNEVEYKTEFEIKE